MINRQSIQLKAFFLLLVFSLNTVVGFACSVGMDLRFSAPHSKEEATAPSVHIHADGKKHQHEKEPVKTAVHVHADGKKHEHAKKEPIKDSQEKTSKKDKSDCCNDEVLKFQQLDKNLNQNLNKEIPVSVLLAMPSIFLGIDIFNPSTAPQLAIIRYLFPPPPDIRISIHRFQI